MRQRLTSSVVGVLLVLSLSAIILWKLEQWQERRTEDAAWERPQSVVMLIAYDGDRFPGDTASGSLRRVGCQDYLVPTEISVLSPRLSSVLSALTEFVPPAGLKNPLQEKDVRFAGMEEGEDGQTVILLEGHPSFGGVCDTPRFKAQIEETVRLYAKRFEIRLNGSEAEYRCAGDLKGDCR